MEAAALISSYEQLVTDGKIKPDDNQREIMRVFATLEEEGTRPAVSGLRKLIAGKKQQETIRGVYLWGHVGRGKSMLMDIFYNRSGIHPKQRVHFHRFMLDVHARVHAWRKQHGSDQKSGNPVVEIARLIAKEVRLLCLDELQVTDVADAMILEQLFLTLSAEGVRVVFTSNRKPEDLYQGGIQRDRFMQFIRLVREQLIVLSLTDGDDYRMKQIKSLDSVYLYPVNARTQKELNDTFIALTSNEKPYMMDLEVQGRSLHVPEVFGGIAKLSFNELCSKALGASDYIAIAQHFHTVLLSGIPKLTPEKRNEAKRFITLIDTLYEHKVKLICTADDRPEKLYTEGDGAFEFGRTVSRLVEMQSERYLSTNHQIIKIVQPQYASNA